MRKLRHYIAWCDDGHDHFEFEYTSESRAGSKQNIEDAKSEYRRRKGRRNFEIKNVWLVKE